MGAPPPDAPSAGAQVAAVVAPEPRCRRSPGHDGERMAALAAAAVLLATAGWVTFESLQQDLAAYVVAGRARALGLDPYVNHLPRPGGPWDGLALYRHSRFLYPPILAELFRPLGALPYIWAKGLFSFASVAALALGLRIARADASAALRATVSTILPAGLRMAAREAHGEPALGYALLAAALWPPVFVALERGQLDLLLLPLLAFAWRRRHVGPVGSGIALALAALAKPFLLVTWPLLLCARRVPVVVAASAALAGLMAVGAAVAGPTLSRSYLSQVLPRAMVYGEGGPADWLLPEAGQEEDGDGRVSLDRGGRSFPLEIGHFRRNASVVRALAGDEDPSRVAGAIVLAILGGVLAIAAARRPEHPAWFWGAPLAGLTAAPVGWAMSLTLGLPLLFVAAARRDPAQRPVNIALGVAAAAGLLAPVVPATSPLASWAWPLVAVGGVAAAALAATRTSARSHP